MPTGRGELREYGPKGVLPAAHSGMTADQRAGVQRARRAVVHVAVLTQRVLKMQAARRRHSR